MTNSEILQRAMAQSAADSSCLPEEFAASVNKIVLSAAGSNARKYLDLPFCCDFTSYGNNIVASVSPELADTARQYIDKYPAEHCFETPNMQVINDELKKRGFAVCFMAEYFLPDTNVLKPLDPAMLKTGVFRNYYICSTAALRRPPEAPIVFSPSLSSLFLFSPYLFHIHCDILEIVSTLFRACLKT